MYSRSARWTPDQNRGSPVLPGGVTIGSPTGGQKSRKSIPWWQNWFIWALIVVGVVFLISTVFFTLQLREVEIRRVPRGGSDNLLPGGDEDWPDQSDVPALTDFSDFGGDSDDRSWISSESSVGSSQSSNRDASDISSGGGPGRQQTTKDDGPGRVYIAPAHQDPKLQTEPPIDATVSDSAPGAGAPSPMTDAPFISIILPVRTSIIPIDTFISPLVSCLERFGSAGARGLGHVNWGESFELLVTVPRGDGFTLLHGDAIHEAQSHMADLCASLSQRLYGKGTKWASEQAALPPHAPRQPRPKVCRLLTVDIPSERHNMLAVMANTVAKVVASRSTHLIFLDPTHRPIHLSKQCMSFFDSLMWPFTNGTTKRTALVTTGVVTATVGVTTGAAELFSEVGSAIQDFVVGQGFDMSVGDGAIVPSSPELRVIRRYSGYPATFSDLKNLREVPVKGATPLLMAVERRHFYRMRGFNITLPSAYDHAIRGKLDRARMRETFERLYARKKSCMDLVATVSIEDVQEGSEELRAAIRKVAGGMTSLAEEIDAIARLSTVAQPQDDDHTHNWSPIVVEEEAREMRRLRRAQDSGEMTKPDAMLKLWDRTMQSMEDALTTLQLPTDDEVGVDFCLRTFDLLMADVGTPLPSSSTPRRKPRTDHVGRRIWPNFVIATPATVRLHLDIDYAIPKVVFDNYLEQQWSHPTFFAAPVTSFRFMDFALTHFPQYAFEKPRLRVIWDMVCCMCCGFSSEVVHYIRPLQRLRELHISFDTSCFCRGYPKEVRAAIDRTGLISNGYAVTKHSHLAFTTDSSDEQNINKSVAVHEDIIVKILHRPPPRYNSGMQFAMELPPDYFVGRSMFEFNKIPEVWADFVLNSTDELWVPGAFVRDVFIAAGVPAHYMHIVPEAVDTNFWDPAIERGFPTLSMFPQVEKGDRFLLQPATNRSIRMFCNRQGGGAGGGKTAYRRPNPFVYFSAFKWEPRKGWDVLFNAYFDAFSSKNPANHGEEEPNVIMYISTFVYIVAGVECTDAMNVTYIVEDLTKFAQEVLKVETLDDLPPFCLMVDDFTEEEVVTLYREADAFVLPTRGEGWGLPLIQAMAMGLPTIGTGWGGQSEFMNTSNSFVINYTLSNVTAPHWMYFEEPGTLWAEPDVAHTTQLIRTVFDDRKLAGRIAAAGRRTVVQHFSEDVIADLIDRRLDAIRKEVMRRRLAKQPRRRGFF